MLTFNDLLTLQGVDPTQVRLVRHQDRPLRAGRLYEAWRNDRAVFEAYQSAQLRDVFPVEVLKAVVPAVVEHSERTRVARGFVDERRS